MCMSTPSRTSPTSEFCEGEGPTHWDDEFFWGGCVTPTFSPPQEHGAGPAVPRPAGVYRRHEFPHGFDHQRAHVRGEGPTPPWGGSHSGGVTEPWGQPRGHGSGSGTWCWCSSHVHPRPCPRIRVPISVWAPAFRGWMFSLLTPKLSPSSLFWAANPSATAGCST